MDNLSRARLLKAISIKLQSTTKETAVNDFSQLFDPYPQLPEVTIRLGEWTALASESIALLPVFGMQPQPCQSQTFAALKSNGLNTNGTISTHRLSPLIKLLGREVKGFLTIASHGLGCQVGRTIVKTFVELQFTAIFLLTPIDHEYL